MTERTHELESQLHAAILREIARVRRNNEQVRRHCALSEDLAAEKQQHGNTQQELCAVRQDNLHLVNDLKVRPCCLISPCVSVQSVLKDVSAYMLQCCACQPWLFREQRNACIFVACSKNCVAHGCYYTPCHRNSKLLLCPAQLSSPVGHNFSSAHSKNRSAQSCSKFMV